MPGDRHPASPGIATKHLPLWLESDRIPLNVGAWPPDLCRGVHLEPAPAVKAACWEDLSICAVSMSKMPSNSPRRGTP
ncbi:hypothetical protein BSU04_29865 [Caballeronia sordidicola]|uniref:Uncharacterized protein n=1 Tax=Caballeronia sordidicola TaxID=196367 RepID=A0A226WVJ7_CABSO|nr:hypothetical protein BSU04_29865 [Caballeronia sordidicola]